MVEDPHVPSLMGQQMKGLGAYSLFKFVLIIEHEKSSMFQGLKFVLLVHGYKTDIKVCCLYICFIATNKGESFETLKQVACITFAFYN